MKDFLKKNYFILLVILCLFIGFLPVIINNDSILIFNGDDYHQIFQFYLGGARKLKEGLFATYDFSIGFGANAFAMVYYLMSPFFLITALLKDNLIQYSFLYFTMIKLLILFCFVRLWAKEIFKNESSILIGSFIITFSGWVFSYLHLYVFLDAFILYPLSLFFIEKYVKNKKFVGLVLTMSVIGIINYYFLYMFIPFACIYALMRCIELKDNLKTIINKGLKFVGLIFLSVGIATFILIPCAYMLKSNPRFDNNLTLFTHISKNDLFKIYSGLFYPALDHESTNMLIDLNKYNFIGWGGGASLHMMSISMILIPLIFKLKNKIRRNNLIILFVIFSLMVFFKSIWYVLQLNIETRWFYMISFIIAYGVMGVNDELEDGLIEKKNIIFGILFYILNLILLFLISYIFKLSTRLDMTIRLVAVYIILAAAIYFYYLKNIRALLAAVLMLESILHLNLLVKIDKPVDKLIVNNASNDYELIKHIKDDSGFYRIFYNDEYIDLFRYTTSNTPYANNYNGLSFYSTIYNSEMEDFLKRLKNNWQMDQRYSSWEFYNLLSLKYLYSKSDMKIVPYGYKLKEKYNDYLIYENDNYLELGFAYDKTMSIKDFNKLSYLEQDLALSDYLIVEEGKDSYQNDLIDYGSMGIENERYFAFEYPLSNVNIYIENGTIENTQVDMFYQNELIYSGYFWQYNYLDFYIDETQKVDLIVVRGNNENQQYGVTLKVKDMSKYQEYFQNRFKETFNDVKFKNDYIEADIEILDKEKWVFTSVGYSEGWKVYVDGKEVAKSKVNLGFVGFKVDKGKHHIKMVYEPPYYKISLGISFVSLLVLLILKKRIKL